MSTARHDRRESSPIPLLDPPFWDAYDPNFPDSDGRPMADNQTQYKWMVTIAEGLDDLYRDRLDVLVACDLLWYFDPDDRRRCCAPDVFVAFGRPKAPRHSYKEWLEGHAPQVVFEIHSPSNTPAEMGRKLRLYDGRGVEEYYYYFPEEAAGQFDGWRRGPGGLEPIASTDGWTSPRLGVTFEAPPVDNALVLRRPDGEAFQHVQDIMKDRRAMRRLARVERRRRRAEQGLREEAESRRAESERLARDERLRREESDRLREESDRLREEAVRAADDERRRREAAEAEARRARDRAERMAARLREMGLEED
ncbi:Uma2 family endonuclease [Paludisphaera sp.]|uniref:Uma2 family endonuclease n=1 Tax=Paludisphaera sp. TaxID=2017432 RepID=UPI00301C385B